MDEDRLRHSLTVANKMVEIGKSKGYSEEQIEDLMPYQQYALDMYNKNSNLSFTMFGWNK